MNSKEVEIKMIRKTIKMLIQIRKVVVTVLSFCFIRIKNKPPYLIIDKEAR